MTTNTRIQIAGCCGGIVLFVGMILLIVSFTYVEYNEYAFKRIKSSNKVNTNRVYKNGRYLWGPDADTITFNRDYQRIDYEDLSVSDAEGKGFYMDASFFYKVKRKNLKELYSKFGTSFHSTIKSKAQSTIKNTAPIYTIEEYLNNRTDITEVMNKNVTDELNTIWIELGDYKFFIKQITLEDTTVETFLEIAITTQTNEQSEYEQEATAIRAETTRQVEEWNTNATVLTAETTAEAERIVAVAEAQADLITSTARGKGIAEIIGNFSMTDDSSVYKTRSTFIKLMAILDNEDVKLVDTDNNIIIST